MLRVSLRKNGLRVPVFSKAWIPVLLLGPALGCSDGAGDSAGAVFVDSAGVTIVQNLGFAPDESTVWTLSADPVLSIGSIEGPEELQFFGIAGGHRLSDGRIGVVNAGSRDVRFFGPDGEHLLTLGKRGGGPEEFENPVLAGSKSDTLIIVDRAHHRLTFLHPDEGFVGLARVSDEVGGFLNPAGTFANGQSVFGGAFDMRGIGELKNGKNRAGTFYRSCTLDGFLATDFGDKAGAEFFIKDLEGSGQDSRPALIPFGKIPVATVSPGHLLLSDQEDWEIEVYSPTGELIRLIRQEWDPIPVTDEDGSRHIESVVAQVGDPAQAPQIREYLGGLPLPAHFPPFGDLLADLDGNLWVQDFQRPGAENRNWTIYDSEGVRTARIVLPDQFNPFEIGADYVLGVGWDEMNVEYLRIYALSRPEEG